MNKGFPDVPSLSGEEIVVGVHESGVKLVEGDNTNNKRYYCGNCTKKIHCYVTVEGGQATIHKTCKNDDCECKCRTHYACKVCGYLHPYGELCDKVEKEPEVNKENDSVIEDINEQYRKLHAKQESKIEQ